MMKSGVFVAVLLSAVLIAGKAYAQTAPSRTVVVVPYGEPSNKDPHADQITQNLAAGLQKAGFTTKVVAPIDHLAAVASAPQLCRDNTTSVIVIPEGRYEQTRKSAYAVLTNIISYPTHVELRLDAIDCTGTVAWSTTATRDETRSSAVVDPSNVGSAIDDAFRAALDTVITRFVAVPASTFAASPTPVSAAAVPVALTSPATYLAIPFGQPGIADPRSPDLTRSLVKFMTDRNLSVKTADPVDRLTLFKTARDLCAKASANALVVTDLRLEQVSGRRTHAELRLDLMTCDGAILKRAYGEADTAVGFLNFNPGAVMVDVTEKALKPALAQLFP